MNLNNINTYLSKIVLKIIVKGVEAHKKTCKTTKMSEKSVEFVFDGFSFRKQI